MNRLIIDLVLGIATRRSVVVFLLGLAFIGYGRHLRSNAKELSYIAETKPGYVEKTFDPGRFESYREDGLCLLAFGLVVCALSVGVWLWRDPTDTARPQTPRRYTDQGVGPETAHDRD